jgi:polyribonucleotide nucleotidyltransferase
MYTLIEKKIVLSDGRTITIETGKLAKQADGSVLVRLGNTMLLATVVAAREVKEDVDFMPLSVEYKEKFASTGRIPGGFMKRESKPSDYEILIARLVDRALRPLFPDDFHAETFVTVNLISADKDMPPDCLAGLAASTALTISDIPFNGPISEVRVARVNGQLKINPLFSELEKADLDIIVGATRDNILMVEGEMKEISEKEMLDAIRFAHEAIKPQCELQMELAKELKVVKRKYTDTLKNEDLRRLVFDKTYEKVKRAVHRVERSKHERADEFKTIYDELLASFPEGEEVNELALKMYFTEVEKDVVRKMILEEGIRLDGRKTDQIRPIWAEVDYLPATHGSAIFTRGETQSLTTVTLGTKLDEKMIDEALIQGSEKFTLHYNFPPFSIGEARPSRGITRREIGHGNLAHRALKAVMPPDTENPYAVRIVSDILESNGSSSMATVCAGTLALMDAGIKIRKPVSGIAMGLITNPDGKFAILSDILGAEDHLGDMDFKVAGTRDGITATQMDIKVEGLTFEVMAKALEQARVGRLYILDKITETMPAPRSDLKPHAPRIVQLSVPKEYIGAIIGPGGKIIQELQRETGTTIIIEETDGKGVVDVFADNKESIDKAVKKIREIVAEPEIGEVYQGKVKAIVAFGAFVEILPGKEGLLHISEIEHRRIENVSDVLKEGDIVEVKLIDIDQKTGKFKLSRKALLPKPERLERRKPHGNETAS